MSWCIVITEEMRCLGLRGNDLLIYAIIHGYSQGEQGCFYGSLATLAERCGISRRTALTSLQSLTEAGFLRRTEMNFNGVKRVEYTACENFTGGEKFSPNNKDIEIKEDNKHIKKDSLKRVEKNVFVVPSIDEVAAYCSERRNGIDAQTFIDFYSARGWKLSGDVSMKDWKAAVRIWESRRKADGEKRKVAPKEKSGEASFGDMIRMLEENHRELAKYGQSNG